MRCSSALISSGSEPSFLASFSRAAGERLADLVVVHGLGQQAILDGVLLDVLLDGTGGFLGCGGQVVDLGLLARRSSGRR